MALTSTRRSSLAISVTVVLGLLSLVIAPGLVYGSSGGVVPHTNGGALDASKNGICAAMVVTHGYKCQEFHVTTEDGFILNVQRIPEGRNGGIDGNAGTARNRPPVIIQHGVIMDGATWLLNTADKNLPLILADNGFDVWIANSRGTRFSRRHTSVDNKNPKFWDWSWDEIAAYDLPAVFNFVGGRTKQKINYVGHSLGTLIALTSVSQGKLVDQLNSLVLLSPVAYLSHMNTAIGVVMARFFAGEISTLFGFPEFDPKGLPVSKLIVNLCNFPGVNCYDLMAAFTGVNCCLNSSTVELFLDHEPQPTSTKTMVHLSQIVRRGYLSKYDYGRRDKNLARYGTPHPPVYNLSNVPSDLPMFVSYGGKDALSDIPDVLRLLDDLKLHDVGKLTVQFIKEYAHADFVMGINANELVYSRVTRFLKLQQQ